MNTRNLLWQVPLFIALSSPLWWGGAANLLDPKKEIAKTTVLAERNFSMAGVTISQRRDGEEEFLLKAKKMSSRDNQKMLTFEDVDAVLFATGETIDVSSKEAVYDTEKGIITLLSNVKLLSSQGHSIHTSALRYLTKYKKVKSAAPMDFSSDRMTISGTSFFYDLTTGNFRVGRRVLFNLW